MITNKHACPQLALFFSDCARALRSCVNFTGQTVSKTRTICVQADERKPWKLKAEGWHYFCKTFFFILFPIVNQTQVNSLNKLPFLVSGYKHSSICGNSHSLYMYVHSCCSIESRWSPNLKETVKCSPVVSCAASPNAWNTIVILELWTQQYLKGLVSISIPTMSLFL